MSHGLESRRHPLDDGLLLVIVFVRRWSTVRPPAARPGKDTRFSRVICTMHLYVGTIQHHFWDRIFVLLTRYFLRREQREQPRIFALKGCGNYIEQRLVAGCPPCQDAQRNQTKTSILSVWVQINSNKCNNQPPSWDETHIINNETQQKSKRHDNKQKDTTINERQNNKQREWHITNSGELPMGLRRHFFPWAYLNPVLADPPIIDILLLAWRAPSF